MKYVQYNIGKYYEQRRVSRTAIYFGIITTSFALFTPLTIAAGVMTGTLGLTSLIINIDAEKWLYRSSLSPVLYGGTIKRIEKENTN